MTALPAFLLFLWLPGMILPALGRGDSSPGSPGTAHRGPGQTSASNNSSGVSGPAASQAEPVIVQGRVRLTGNEPFSELIISDAEGTNWYIDRAERPALDKYQQRVVTIHGVPGSLELILANGEYIGTRRTLRDIKILAAPE